MRLLAVLVCLLVTLLAAAATPPAGTAATATAKPARAKIVCFAKTVKAKSGRKVRRKVCRARRKAPLRTAKPPSTVLAPTAGPTAAPAPASVIPRGPATVAPPTGTAAPVPAPPCVPDADATFLTATALDLNQKFVLRLSRTCLRAGRTVLQYRNDDAQDHDLWIEGLTPAAPNRAVIAPVAPATMEQAELDLTAGDYRLFCSITGHGNMSRTVTITP